MGLLIALFLLTVLAAAVVAPRFSSSVRQPAPIQNKDALLRAAARFHAPLRRRFRRAADVLLSVVLLAISAPLLLTAAIAIKLEGPGPVIYRQRRVGRGGCEFYILKLRSMRADAEACGPQYARPDDCRATRIGRVLRKYHIDEIPQTINVLRGDMSLIGPRPERPRFTAVFEREIMHYACRHLVRPGITGWAQINLDYADSVQDARDKLAYDLDYISRHSLGFDLLILAKTARVALFGLARGVKYAPPLRGRKAGGAARGPFKA